MSSHLERKTLFGLMISALVAAFALSACGGDDGSLAGEASSSPPSSTVDEMVLLRDAGPCKGGRLTVAGLEQVQEDWEEGLRLAKEAAVAWQRDATLVSARLTCGFLSPGTVVKATFYSDTARTLFFSYTSETRPVDPGVPAPPQLFTEGVSFGALHDALIEAGYSERAEIHPSSGIYVRYNGTTTPFGPESAPAETIILHLIIVQEGTVQDVFVSVEDWALIPINDQ
ncbi:MAG TPA: hypothetical protein VGR16_02900 [Thermomicrobiales bacterium]|nr:hypothetical protein [Thermomicrobiales bacterium]